MTQITHKKRLIEVAKKVSQSTIKKDLTRVKLKGTMAVATDSFCLLEVDLGVEVPESMISAKKILRAAKGKTKIFVEDGTLRAIDPDQEVNEVLEADTDTTFPDYERIMPKDAPQVTLTFSPKILGEILKAFSTMGAVGVKMEYHGDGKPLVITENVSERRTGTLGKTRALVMPMVG